MTVLDDLSGFEFEDVMEDVFRNLGYENVRQADRVADEGRDILMEERVDGRLRAIVVECKHTDAVGRPVVQKLHSAVATHDYDGPARGMVVTTGRFTGPAEEYARNLRENDDPNPIELLDGDDLREIAEEVGLDLYNGRIEILCEETLRPTDPSRSPAYPAIDAFHDVKNLHAEAVPDPHTAATFVPFVRVQADVDSVFETSVGIIHRVHESDELVVRADRNGPTVPETGIQHLVAANYGQRVALDEDAFADEFDDLSQWRYGQTETEYKEWAVEQLRRAYTTTVSYTGDNNVTYTKECEPNVSDVSVQAIDPVYVPRIALTAELGEYTYPYEYYAAGPSRETVTDGVRRCVQCGETEATTYTYCENCGSINCPEHIETERLHGDPVCTGCAVTESFFYSTNYFYSEENLEAFRTEYERMGPHEKAMENRPLAAALGVGGAVVLVLVVALVASLVLGLL